MSCITLKYNSYLCKMEKSFDEQKAEMKKLFMCLESDPIDQRIEICNLIDKSNTCEEFSEKLRRFIDKAIHVRLNHK